MHKQGLQQESELSSKRIIIADMENTFKFKSTEFEGTIKRLESTFSMER